MLEFVPEGPNQSLAVSACVDDDAEDAMRSGDLNAAREAGLHAMPALAGEPTWWRERLNGRPSSTLHLDQEKDRGFPPASRL